MTDKTSRINSRLVIKIVLKSMIFVFQFSSHLLLCILFSSRKSLININGIDFVSIAYKKLSSNTGLTTDAKICCK